jgi:hypothetical protein
MAKTQKRTTSSKSSKAKSSSRAKKAAPKKAAEPFWDESALTSVEDLRRDSLGPSRRADLKRQYG